MLGAQEHPALKTATVACRFKAGGGEGAMKAALEAICEEAAAKVEAGAQVVVLSDRVAGDLDPDAPAIPALLAVGAVHHHLIQVRVATPPSNARPAFCGPLATPRIARDCGCAVG